MVRVGGDVSNELLRREREEPCQSGVGGWGWRKARLGEVVVRYGVGDLGIWMLERWTRVVWKGAGGLRLTMGA